MTVSGDYCSRYRDLLPQYALGNVVGEEAGALREHLDSCAVCRREIHELEEALHLLPLGLPVQAPPGHLKDRLLEQLDLSGVEPGAPLLSVAPAPIGVGRERSGRVDRVDRPVGERRAPLRRDGRAQRSGGSYVALAAVMLAFAGLSGGGVWGYFRYSSMVAAARREEAKLRGEAEAARAALAERERLWHETEAERTLLREPDLELVILRPTEEPREGEPEPSGRLLWTRARGAGLLFARGLPRPAEDRDYQLWFMVKDAAQKGDPKPVSAGLLRARADGAFAIEVSVPKEGALAAAAITLEKKGGAEKPTTTPLLSGAI